MYFLKPQIHLMRILQIFGLFWFNIETDLRPASSFFSFVVNCIWIIFDTTMLILLIDGKESVMGAKGIFLTCGVLETVLTQIPCYVFFFFNTSEKMAQEIFFKNMGKCEENLRHFGVTIKDMNYYFSSMLRKESLILLSIVTLIQLVVQIFSFVSYINFKNEELILTLSWYIKILLSAYCMNILMIFLLNIVKSFEGYLKLSQQKMRTFNNQQAANFLRITFEIKQLIEEFSETFGVIIVSLYVYCFGIVTFEIFQYVRIFEPNEDYFANKLILLFLAWIALIAALMAKISFACAEVEEIYQISIDQCKSCKMTKALENNMNWLTLELTKFHAAGFFLVDSSIIFNVDMMQLFDCNSE